MKLRLAIVLAVAGAIAVIWHFAGTKKLSYQDHSFDYWFQQLPLTMISSNSIVRVESMLFSEQQYGSSGNDSRYLDAFDSFGTDAIPYLMSKLQRKDSSTKVKINWLARKLGAKTPPFRSASLERAQSVTALIHLKELPPDTLRVLTNLSNHATPDIAPSAKYVLAERSRRQLSAPQVLSPIE